MGARHSMWRNRAVPAAGKRLLFLTIIGLSCAVESFTVRPAAAWDAQQNIRRDLPEIGMLALVGETEPPGVDPQSTGSVILRDGGAFDARLLAHPAAGAWLLSRGDEPISVTEDQLVMWGAYRDRPGQTWVLLTDGSLLVADLLAMDRETFVLAGRLWSEIRIPRPVVRAIVFRPAIELLSRDRLFYRALTEVRVEDQLLLENGDELTGRLPDELKPEPGAFHPDRIRWPVSGTTELVEMPLERVSALLLANPPLLAPAAAGNGVWVGLSDGSRLLVSHLARAAESLEIELACQVQLATDPINSSASEPFDAVTMLQPLATDVTYLSDMQPLGYKHIPFLEMSWPYMRDRSVSGGQLRCGGDVYRKGLGMHSSSRLAYQLEQPYRSLQAELALDERAGRDGSVVYRVYTRGAEGQWVKAFESDVVRGNQEPISMRVDVQGASAIALIVDFADRADQWDHANWLNVRLVQ